MVLLDTECTDFQGRVIEIEIAIVSHDGEVLLETLVNPDGEPIVPEAFAVHGITDQMVRAAHLPRFGDLIDEVVSLLEGRRILCWNSAYDSARLAIEADRLVGAPSTATEVPPFSGGTRWLQRPPRPAPNVSCRTCPTGLCTGYGRAR